MGKYPHSSLEGNQVLAWNKYGQKETVPEFTYQCRRHKNENDKINSLYKVFGK